MNATVTNGGLVLTALLYGKGDFVQTLRLSFALGYDADCNAATCGAVLGVLLGAKAMEAHPDWKLPTVYENRTRDGLPKTQTMDDLVAMTGRLAEKVILAEGGQREGEKEAIVYRIFAQAPTLLERLERETNETTDTALAAMDAEALKRLASESAAARTFAAIRLARHRGDGLAAADKQRVTDILRVALRDEVLASLAQGALDVLDKPSSGR